ncbi:farnesol dehydrogenase-like [Diabrotica undecimpunctata]|uniref:farnesol dehydrogenase-like n=1 Tax=Diabrotica undecimpunctata TaxID=50387 RepID=UPI003B63C83F
MVLSLDRWVGKVAVVTGASAGIGAATCELLVKEGIKVVGLARRKNLLDALAEKLKCLKGSFHGIQTDLTKEEEILAAFKEIKQTFGPVHIVINNAGICNNSTLCYGKTELWKEMLDINILGLLIATREAVQSMLENNIEGHVIHINSVLGHKVPDMVPLNIYPSTKFAVTALTDSLKFELNYRNSKIKVTSISPGATESEFFVRSQIPLDHDQVTASVGEELLKPEDVADAIHYVLSTPPHVQVQEVTIKHVTEKI